MSDPIVSSELSLSELLAIFRDYSDYDLENSLARARIYIKAGRMLLSPALVRTSQANRAEEAEFNPEIIERAVSRAVAWYSSRTRAAQAPKQYIPSPDWRDE